MYKLYDMLTIKKLIESEEEQPIVDKLEQVVTDNCYFMVIHEYKGGATTMKGIRNKKDFEGYKMDYDYRKIADAPCVKLKKYIVDRVVEKEKDK